ncbi:amino acid ABC transporter substrate-binding protein [Massilia glaciei]|uniref:Amino acid ABC transporter substrate-binding protein n=1 Tax=Massilia glaciei TaxID=1524097 RepID=A0A2U2H9X9_9BURK|nr:amino acid ABC transporter substrate-binding protein [Massilia glaciei]
MLRRAAVLAALLCANAGAAPTTVVFPRPEGSSADLRGVYAEQLLAAALAYSGGKYQTRPSRLPMQQSRAVSELARGAIIDVLWTMTTREREQQMLPIRIPIDKGLIGWRLLLVRDADQAKFGAITGNAELKALTAVQGRDWPDRAILEANGYQVYGSSSYESSFSMLIGGRIDYFPRSVREVWGEIARFGARGLSVAPGVGLHYPAAMYFFVNQGNKELGRDLEAGLEKMLADGAFDRLFYKFHDEALRKSDFKSRRIFELGNPVLPERTPLARKQLWLFE